MCYELRAYLEILLLLLLLFLTGPHFVVSRAKFKAALRASIPELAKSFNQITLTQTRISTVSRPRVEDRSFARRHRPTNHLYSVRLPQGITPGLPR